MKTQEMLDPKRWAERTFGEVQLHDMRRTRRDIDPFWWFSLIFRAISSSREEAIFLGKRKAKER